MMATELQDLVDRLGRELRRSVAVDDVDLRIIAYGDHYGDEDPVRLQALLGRGASEHMRGYLAGHRISAWHEPRYMDADEGLGLKRRLAVPLRSGPELVGYLWVIVSGDLEPAEFELVLDTAAAVTSLLVLGSGRRADAERRLAELVAGVLQGPPEAAARAAAILGGEPPFAGASSFSVLVIVRSPGADTGDSPGGIPGLDAVRRAMGSRPRDAHGVAVIDGVSVVLLGSRAPLGAGDAEELGRRVHQELRTAGAGGASGASGPVVGVGGPVSGWERIRDSLGQARVAASAAASDARGSRAWAELGPAALLPALVREPLRPHLIPEEFSTALAGQDAATLHLVETYLEAAGSAADTAELLHLHRSSVYYHLGQFQKATGWDLGDGNARFQLQLWFKYRKFAFPAERDVPAGSDGASNRG